MFDITEVPGLGARYASAVALDADFVYVDGPTVRIKTKLPAGKGARLDSFELLDRGGRPRVIMFEGTTDSVDYLRSHPSIDAYEFFPEFIYAWRKRDWRAALAMRRHSVFVLREPRPAGGSPEPGG